MFRSLAAAAAFAGLMTAAPAIAGPPVDKLKGRVSYAGLNLNNPSDIAQFQQRIAREAKRLCTLGLPDRAWSGPDVKACRASVAASAERQIAMLVGGRLATAK